MLSSGKHMCMYTHAHPHTCTPTHPHMHTNAHTHAHKCTHAYMDTGAHTHLYTHRCACTPIYTIMCACTPTEFSYISRSPVLLDSYSPGVLVSLGIRHRTKWGWVLLKLVINLFKFSCDTNQNTHLYLSTCYFTGQKNNWMWELPNHEPWTQPTQSGKRNPSSSRLSCFLQHHLETDREGVLGAGCREGLPKPPLPSLDSLGFLLT